MYVVWTKHLQNEEDKDKFRGSVYNSKKVLERLKDILNDMEKDLDIAEVSPKTYEVPNWSYRQAHNNGYRQCIYHMKKLIDLDQQKEPNERNTTDGRQLPIIAGPPNELPKRTRRRTKEVQNS